MYNSFDLIFFLGSLLAVLAVGFWSTRRQKSTVNDYFRGGNRLPWYAIGFSIIAAGISSEQFVGEIGYAYRWGMPVVNWEWLVFPAMTILLWVFVPLYIRNNVTTMPEYLEDRFGGRARTLYAHLSVVVCTYGRAGKWLVFRRTAARPGKDLMVCSINKIVGNSCVWLRLGLPVLM